MAALNDETETFWAFVHYITHNPYKAAGGMTNLDIVAMAKFFADANGLQDEGVAMPDGYVGAYLGDVTGEPPTYIFTNAQFPISGGGGGAQAYATTAAIDVAWYPERHEGS